MRLKRCGPQKVKIFSNDIFQFLFSLLYGIAAIF